MIKTEPGVSESIDSRSLKIEKDKDSEKFFSEGIKHKHLNILVDSKKILKQLDKKNIYKNLDSDLTELYIKDLKKNFSIQEIKFMKKTLESDVTKGYSHQSFFVSIFSILVVLMTTIFSNVVSSTNSLEKNETITNIIVVLVCYLGMIIFYYFYNQIFNERKVKLVNHLNLIIAETDFNKN